VCIKQLGASPEMRDRLRELGLGEKQKIKLISRHSNFICQVCHGRLGLSQQLAENILVEPIPGLVPVD
jgi:Fe2+ transport system protein FeoA